MPERHVADVLREVFRRGGMVRAVRRAEAVVAWPRIVGPELARFAQARALRSGVLFVDVPDSETAMHLSLQRERVLNAYQRFLGHREVRDVRFVAGRRPRHVDAPAPVAPHDPDPDEWSALAQQLGRLDLPSSLAGPALDAARAMLAHRRRARRSGWTPCPHCGALAPEPGPCDACARHRQSARVRTAADRLMLHPGTYPEVLTDDERAVARALAVERLDAHIAELLPQVLASPALRPQLERAAIHSIALRDDRPVHEVGDADLYRLDPRIVRVLGRWGAPSDEGGTAP